MLRSRLMALTICAALALPGLARAQATDIQTPASHAFLIDAMTGTVLINKNGDELMPPSSMSKLMTAYMVFERLKAGTLKLTDTFPVSEKAWRTGGSKMFVRVGDRVSVQDLLRGVIVQSGNDACIVLAEGLAGDEDRFAAQMTERARQIGLTRSVFKNATGLPDPEHRVTARDLAILAQRIIQDFPDYYFYYSEIDFTYNNIKQGNRNPLLYKNMGADGLKTGHTEEAGFGLTASVKRGDRRLILVVNGLSSMDERSSESERLMEIGFREFDTYKLAPAGKAMAEAPVWLGQAQVVPLVPAKDLVVTLPRRLRDRVQATVTLTGPVPAPIQQGQALGELLLRADGMEPISVPLVAGQSVERMGFFSRALHRIKAVAWN